MHNVKCNLGLYSSRSRFLFNTWVCEKLAISCENTWILWDWGLFHVNILGIYAFWTTFSVELSRSSIFSTYIHNKHNLVWHCHGWLFNVKMFKTLLLKTSILWDHWLLKWFRENIHVVSFLNLYLLISKSAHCSFASFFQVPWLGAQNLVFLHVLQKSVQRIQGDNLSHVIVSLSF